MIYKTGNPLSPFVKVLIDGKEVRYTSIVSLNLHLNEGEHDLCEIAIAGIAPRAVTDYIDAPVYAAISSGKGRVQEFHGYVTFVEVESVPRAGLVNRSPFQVGTLSCLGASSVMRGDKMKVWENVTVPLVAQTLAKKYKFSVDVPKDEYSVPRDPQMGESDWAFLNRIVHEFGYRMSAHGTHIHIYDPNKATGRAISYTPLLTARKSTGGRPGEILEFEGMFGYVTPKGESAVYKTQVWDQSGRVTVITGDSSKRASFLRRAPTTKYTHEVPGTSPTVSMAQTKLDIKIKDHRPFTATATVTAGAGIKPGGLVSLNEYNSDFDGLWYVNSVSHYVVGNLYRTKLELARDFVLNSDFEISRIKPVSTPPEPLLVNGTWVSQNNRASVYG